MHSSSAVVVATSGPPSAPVVVHRAHVTLIDDERLEEPFHAATTVPLTDAPALIDSVKRSATAAAAVAIGELAASLGSVVAVGVVGGNRKLPELSRILSKHALLHAAERALYEEAIIDAATQAGLPVTTIPATGSLIDHASDALGLALGPVLAALGKQVGPPWQKDHREATAAALVALHAPT